MKKICVIAVALAVACIVAVAIADDDRNRMIAVLRQVLSNRQSLYVSKFNSENDDKAVHADWDYAKTNVVLTLSSGKTVTNTIPAQIMLRYDRVVNYPSSD